MSKIYQEYKDRTTFKGSTTQEYVKTVTQESIQDLINNSQYGFEVTINDALHKIAVMATYTNQEYDSATVIAPLNLLSKGSVFLWGEENWIILKQMFRPDQPGFNGTAYRCTNYLSWVDEDGSYFKQPAFVRSSKVTNSIGVTPENTGTFENLLTHEANWSLMAATKLNLNLHKDMRFIIKGQAYRISNVDNISIDGVSIITFEDDTILDSDDLVNEIAYDSIYEIKPTISSTISLGINNPIDFPVIVLRNGEEDIEAVVTAESDYEEVVVIENNKLKGLAIGSTSIKFTLQKNPTVTLTMDVEVTEIPVVNPESIIVLGNDDILWNSTETYMLSNGGDATFIVEYPNKVKCTTTNTANSVSISIKDKYAGTIIIRAVDINNITYIKQVNIKTI